MSRKTKALIKKIAAIVGIVLAAAGIIVLLGYLFGNPVSYLLARRAANGYTAAEFSGDGYEIVDTDFNRERRTYTVKVAVPGSADKYFTVFSDMFGRVTGNTSHSVKKGENTWMRIDEAYDALVSGALADFAHKKKTVYGEIRLLEEYNGRPGMEYGIDASKLTADAEYDPREYGAKAGAITAVVWGEEVSAEHAAEILVEIRGLLDKAGVPFCAVDLSLRAKEMPSDKDINVTGITYDEIGLGIAAE